MIRIGCSGWAYDDWRDRVYPPGTPARSWLEYYATLFDTVEVNATFYRLPSRATVEGWAQRTPPGFLFAVKASRYLTHVKRLTDLAPGIGRFFERVEPLAEAGKLGPVLWQLPESLHRDDDRLGTALAALPSGQHAFEFRHASWFVPEVEALLRARGVALVIGDAPQRRFQTRWVTAPFAYLRFHYGRGKDGSYTERQLDEWATWIRAVSGSADVFAYFNNDWQGFAVENARRLCELVA